MFPIFDKLGGKDAALDVIAAARSHFDSPRPTHHAEKIWRRDRELPGAVIKILWEECERRGIGCELSDFRMPTPSEGQAA
jgi:hypothetical protein